jgi:hypothetical protein
VAMASHVLPDRGDQGASIEGYIKKSVCIIDSVPQELPNVFTVRFRISKTTERAKIVSSNYTNFFKQSMHAILIANLFVSTF